MINNQNLQDFDRVMSLIREKDPESYVKLYIQALSLGAKSPIRLSTSSPYRLRLRHLLIRLVGFRVFFRLYKLFHPPFLSKKS